MAIIIPPFLNCKCAVSEIPYTSDKFLKDNDGFPLYCLKVSGDLKKDLVMNYTQVNNLTDWVLFAGPEQASLWGRE